MEKFSFLSSYVKSLNLMDPPDLLEITEFSLDTTSEPLITSFFEFY